MGAGFTTDKRIRQTRITLNAEKGVVARTALERRPIHVTDYVSPQDSEEHVLADLNFSTFASVPLIAKDTVIGVMVVDNYVTGETITDDMMDFLHQPIESDIYQILRQYLKLLLYHYLHQ